MIIKFLGSGSAFTIPERDDNYQSNILITKTGVINGETYTKNLLIDAGEQIASSLYHYGYDERDIDYIFITHCHSDHNSGLNFLGYKTYFNPDVEKPTLFANTKVMDTLWENVLKGNMESINGVGRVKLSNYFNTISIFPKDGFQFLNTEFFPVRMSHVIDDYDELPAFGLKWEENNIKFFMSGDTQFDFWRLFPFWEWADIIFQDCEFAEYENSVHCQYNQLKELPSIYKNRMWLYHYILKDITFEEMNKKVKDDGFLGLIKKGQEFNTKNPKSFLKFN